MWDRSTAFIRDWYRSPVSRKNSGTSDELQSLVRFHDLARAKGVQVMLRLVNTHIEDLPATNSTAWLGAIEQAGRVRR